MPYKIVKRDGDKPYCVYKHAPNGDPVGDPLGCHPTEAAATEQMQALYASEPGTRAIAVKMVDGSDDVIEGPGMPFGGPFKAPGKPGGQDLYGEHFTKDTDFAFDWFSERPFLWHHGLDPDVRITVAGRVKSWEVRADLGVWTKVQLDKSNEYFSAIRDLVAQKKVYFSSGAMAHLVQTDPQTGAIKRWPWVELSGTPSPANFLANVDFASAAKHYEMAGLKAIWDEKESSLRAAMSTEQRNQLSDSDFAYIDSQGGRHLPINDAEHCRNAIARFSQTQFESEEAKTKARNRIMAAAKRLGIEVGEDSMKAAPALKSIPWEEVGAEVRHVLDDRWMLRNPFSPDGCVWVKQTFSDHVIVSVYSDDGEKCYSVPFTLDTDGHVASVGDAIEVEETYIPVKLEQPIAAMAWTASRYAASLLERTKDLQARRLKERRVISDTNRKRLMACMDQMGAAMKEMQTLLDSTAPQSAKAASVRRLRAQLVARQVEAAALICSSKEVA